MNSVLPCFDARQAMHNAMLLYVQSLSLFYETAVNSEMVM